MCTSVLLAIIARVVAALRNLGVAQVLPKFSNFSDFQGSSHSTPLLSFRPWCRLATVTPKSQTVRIAGKLSLAWSICSDMFAHVCQSVGKNACKWADDHLSKTPKRSHFTVNAASHSLAMTYSSVTDSVNMPRSLKMMMQRHLVQVATQRCRRLLRTRRMLSLIMQAHSNILARPPCP